VASAEIVPQGTVAGRVTDARTMGGVYGAQIYVPGTGYGALANADGRFAIAGVPGGEHVLGAQIIGYATQEQVVTVRTGVRHDLHVHFDGTSGSQLVAIEIAPGLEHDVAGADGGERDVEVGETSLASFSVRSVAVTPSVAGCGAGRARVAHSHRRPVSAGWASRLRPRRGGLPPCAFALAARSGAL
jgi:hypothetical protein